MRLLALAVVVNAALWAAAVAAETASVQVQVIYATNAESGIDPALTPHAQSFSSFRYSAYKRVGGQTLRLAGTTTVSMDLPGGRRLDVVPRGITPEATDLRVAVYEGGRKLVVSDLRLVPGGQPVIVGGFKHQSGVLFLAIQALR